MAEGNEIDILKQRVLELEKDCQRLSAENELLRQGHTVVSLKTEEAPTSQQTTPQVIDQGKVHKNSPPHEKVELFRSLFRGRDDVYPERWENRQGKSGYSPAYDKSQGFIKDRDKRENLPLTDQTVFDHLSGKIVAGVYALLKDDYCYFLAADFDKKTWQQDCLIFLEACDKLKIPASFERSRSGNGGHVWIFFQEAVPAHLARKLGSIILTQAMESRPQLGLDSYDRFFPSQDTLPSGGYGNLIALPLQKEARKRGGSEFIDRGFQAYTDQWAHLSGIERVSFSQLESIVKSARSNGDLLGMRYSLENDEDMFKPWELKPSEDFCSKPLTRGLFK